MLSLNHTISVNEKLCFILSILSQRTFHYDSRYWKNKETVTPDGGKTGFDLQETKLPSYWNTSFSKICLGMRINNQSRFIVIKRTATSLHSLIADGKYRNTSLGRDTWKSLIGSEASMQFNCNREGFNAKSDKQYSPGRDQAKARIESSATMKTIAVSVTPESGLALEEFTTTSTHVETRLKLIHSIMATNILKQWAIFWCSERQLIWADFNCTKQLIQNF